MQVGDIGNVKMKRNIFLIQLKCWTHNKYAQCEFHNYYCEYHISHNDATDKDERSLGSSAR